MHLLKKKHILKANKEKQYLGYFYILFVKDFVVQLSGKYYTQYHTFLPIIFALRF